MGRSNYDNISYFQAAWKNWQSNGPNYYEANIESLIEDYDDLPTDDLNDYLDLNYQTIRYSYELSKFDLWDIANTTWNALVSAIGKKPIMKVFNKITIDDARDVYFNQIEYTEGYDFLDAKVLEPQYAYNNSNILLDYNGNVFDILYNAESILEEIFKDFEYYETASKYVMKYIADEVVNLINKENVKILLNCWYSIPISQITEELSYVSKSKQTNLKDICEYFNLDDIKNIAKYATDNKTPKEVLECFNKNLSLKNDNPEKWILYFNDIKGINSLLNNKDIDKKEFKQKIYDLLTKYEPYEAAKKLHEVLIAPSINNDYCASFKKYLEDNNVFYTSKTEDIIDYNLKHESIETKLFDFNKLLNMDDKNKFFITNYQNQDLFYLDYDEVKINLNEDLKENGYYSKIIRELKWSQNDELKKYIDIDELCKESKKYNIDYIALDYLNSFETDKLAKTLNLKQSKKLIY